MENQNHLANKEGQENSLVTSLVPASSNDNIKLSYDDIVHVQNLIERCIQLYMDKDEVLNTLLIDAKIEHGFSETAWERLEQQNPDFFRAYYIRLKLKKQIEKFNQLLERQHHVMKPNVPLAPMQNKIHPMPVIVTGQPNINPVGYSVPNYPIVNGVPAPANFHPMQMNSGNDMVIKTSAGDDVPCSVGLQLPPNNGVDTLGPIPRNFSLSDLTVDLGDIGALLNYLDSPVLPPDSDIQLDSPEQDIVEDFLVDSDFIPG